MKRYDNPSMALDMTSSDDGDYVLYEDALKFAKCCIEMNELCFDPNAKKIAVEHDNV